MSGKPRGPRCGKPMRAWMDRPAGRPCVRPAGHRGQCWSAERYAAHLASMRRNPARRNPPATLVCGEGE